VELKDTMTITEIERKIFSLYLRQVRASSDDQSIRDFSERSFKKKKFHL